MLASSFALTVRPFTSTFTCAVDGLSPFVVFVLSNVLYRFLSFLTLSERGFLSLPGAALSWHAHRTFRRHYLNCRGRLLAVLGTFCYLIFLACSWSDLPPSSPAAGHGAYDHSLRGFTLSLRLTVTTSFGSGSSSGLRRVEICPTLAREEQIRSWTPHATVLLSVSLHMYSRSGV